MNIQSVEIKKENEKILKDILTNAVYKYLHQERFRHPVRPHEFYDIIIVNSCSKVVIENKNDKEGIIKLFWKNKIVCKIFFIIE